MKRAFIQAVICHKMSLIKITALTFLLLPSYVAQCQYLNGAAINESNLRDWSDYDKSNYLGFYFFGDNTRSNVVFRILGIEDSLIVQLEFNYRQEGLTNWEKEFLNLTNVKIDESGVFSSDQFQGKFLQQEYFGKHRNLLKINEALTFFDFQ